MPRMPAISDHLGVYRAALEEPIAREQGAPSSATEESQFSTGGNTSPALGPLIAKQRKRMSDATVRPDGRSFARPSRQLSASIGDPAQGNRLVAGFTRLPHDGPDYQAAEGLGIAPSAVNVLMAGGVRLRGGGGPSKGKAKASETYELHELPGQLYLALNKARAAIKKDKRYKGNPSKYPSRYNAYATFKGQLEEWFKTGMPAYEGEGASAIAQRLTRRADWETAYPEIAKVVAKFGSSVLTGPSESGPSGATQDSVGQITEAAASMSLAHAPKIDSTMIGVTRKVVSAVRDAHACRELANEVSSSVKEFIGRLGMLGCSTLATSEEDKERANIADEEIADLRDWINYDGYSESQAAREGKAHNCHEMSILGRDGLRAEGVPAFMLQLGGDTHTTVVYGPSVVDEMQLPTDMKRWPDDIQILDIFSDLNFPAKQYTTEFVKRMALWSGENYQIRYNQDWMSPNDWVNGVLSGERFISENGDK